MPLIPGSPSLGLQGTADTTLHKAKHPPQNVRNSAARVALEGVSKARGGALLPSANRLLYLF